MCVYIFYTHLVIIFVCTIDMYAIHMYILGTCVFILYVYVELFRYIYMHTCEREVRRWFLSHVEET